MVESPAPASHTHLHPLDAALRLVEKSRTPYNSALKALACYGLPVRVLPTLYPAALTLSSESYHTA